MQRSKSVLAVLGMVFLAASTVNAASQQVSMLPVASAAITVGDTLPPIGWVQFCGERPEECQANVHPGRVMQLDEKRWRQLVRINRDVNENVDPVSDLEHWGTLERWSYPTDGRGDCEDYVLEKRRRLMEAGWPASALLITVVRDKRGDGHAVLTVKTDRGDFVLDNQEARVKGWTETGYRFVKRQSDVHPNKWVSLGGPDTAIFTANR
jgi:predicted transglutaminase-like cysteine proteinase